VKDREPRTLHQTLLGKIAGEHVLWAGCRSNQTSADAKIGGSYHGAFTYYFCQELEAAKGDITRRALIRRVRLQLKSNRYTQVPQLELDATTLTHPIGGLG
jgi:hypothetical protein